MSLKYNLIYFEEDINPFLLYFLASKWMAKTRKKKVKTTQWHEWDQNKTKIVYMWLHQKELEHFWW